jgi:glycosyltransferase involved in cell wall biosynthesis
MNSTKKKYSIILPVKNGGSYIKECVNSILSQTLNNFELVVLIHDCTDGTDEWLKGLGDDRVIIKSQDKVNGITGNWSRILDVPRNEFMTIIGYDDILLPDYLETMDELIGRHPDASLYQAHFSFINETSHKIKDCQPMDEVQDVAGFLKAEFLQTLDSTATGYMMRSADYDRLNGISCRYPNLIFADYELWVRLIAISYKATASQNCFSYRLHESTSKLTPGQPYVVAFEHYLNFLRELATGNKAVEETITAFGAPFMYFFCESLSHRLLKTPVNQREQTVNEFVQRCEQHAKILHMPSFYPRRRFRIWIAIVLDRLAITRRLFMFAKKIIK